jgi:Tfp pilus assembly protein PilF
MDERIKELLSGGVKSFREGDFESAEQSFKQAIDLEPQSAVIPNNYAMLLKKMEQFEDAENHFRVALELDPKNVQIHKNYGNPLKTRNTENNKEEKSEESNQSP